MFKNKIYLIIVFLLVMMSSCSSGSSSGMTTQNVLVITDIHFDPFNSCGTTINESSQSCVIKLINESNPALWSFQSSLPNNYGEETNNTFLTSGLAGLKNIIQNQNITSIFVTGDLVSHQFPSQFNQYVQNGTQTQMTTLVVNTMNYVMYQIHQAVPKAKMYYIMGNNDTDQADYSYPTESFMKQISPVLAPYMESPASFSNQFPIGGYTVMPLSNSVDVIGLNFNPLVIENAGNDKDFMVASEQLIWLMKQLSIERKNNKSVIILQHEPFGMNTYNIATNWSPYEVLQESLQNQYLEVYNSNKDIIKGYYFGHYHMETFLDANDIFGVGTLGFSVDFYNNPGFKILQIAADGALQNFTTYYSNFNDQKFNWQILYQLNEQYNITPNNYVDFFQNQLQPSNNTNWSAFITNYSGNNASAPESQVVINSATNWAIFYCGMNYFDSNNFSSCLLTH